MESLVINAVFDEWREWDREIERDSDSGKLDSLIREAKETGDGTIDNL